MTTRHNDDDLGQACEPQSITSFLQANKHDLLRMEHQRSSDMSDTDHVYWGL
jgi:hypothetical protein